MPSRSRTPQQAAVIAKTAESPKREAMEGLDRPKPPFTVVSKSLDDSSPEALIPRTQEPFQFETCQFGQSSIKKRRDLSGPRLGFIW